MHSDNNSRSLCNKCLGWGNLVVLKKQHTVQCQLLLTDCLPCFLHSLDLTSGDLFFDSPRTTQGYTGVTSLLLYSATLSCPETKHTQATLSEFNTELLIIRLKFNTFECRIFMRKSHSCFFITQTWNASEFRIFHNDRGRSERWKDIWTYRQVECEIERKIRVCVSVD